MRDSVVIRLFERRLIELGCPTTKLRSTVRELGEHHDDLKEAALAEGLSQPDAEMRADRLLGEPETLAAGISGAMRQASWWGRHPVIAFCLLPFLGMLLMAAVGITIDVLVGGFYFTQDELHVLADENVELALLKMGSLITWTAMILLTAVLFCWLARRAACGLKWALLTCAACSIYSGCIRFQFYRHGFTVGCGFPPALFDPANLAPFFAPMIVGAAIWWRQRQKLNRLPVPVCSAAGTLAHRKKTPLPRAGFLSPSSVIATAVVLTVVVMGFWMRSFISQQEAHHERCISQIWPAERASVMQQLRVRQTASTPANARTIKLKPWLNAALADSLGGPADTNANNLSELPRGIQIFGGVPFDVEGRLQLMGRKLLDTSGIFPVRARNIEIGTKCSRIHLLHGASGLTPEMSGTNIASLIVHYVDGSQTRIPIIAGGHVLDWWGPVYDTDAGFKSRNPSAPGSELAWVGGNSCLKRDEPQLSLRLYKSTFDNPRPDTKIVAIDYASTVTDAAPFMVGLTIE